MEEVVRIAPLQNDPGLIAYECPSCGYVTSFFGSTKPQGRITRLYFCFDWPWLSSSAGLAAAPGSTRTARITPSTPAAGGYWPHLRETRGGPEHLRWFWSFAQHGPMMRSGRVKTLEEAKSEFQKSWEEWKAWAKLEEVP